MIPDNLSRVLESNDVPTSFEIDALQAGAAELKAQSRALRKQLRKVEARLNKHLGALSIIRRIPNEIIGEILAYALGTPTTMDKHGRAAVLNMGLVCRSWRIASLLTHELWGNVHIRTSEELGGSYEDIKRWLERSGALPKSLHLYAPQSGRDDHLLSPTTLKLLTDGPPLDHLSFACEYRASLEEFLFHFQLNRQGAPHRPWDNLRSLDMTVTGDFDDIWWFDTEDASNSIFNYLPPITAFKLYFSDEDVLFHTGRWPGSLKLNIPSALLERLTSFDISCGWSGPHIPAMLQHCSNLEHLSVDLAYMKLDMEEEDIAEQPFPLDGILLPKLRTLQLRRHSEDVHILDHLIAPALTSLDIGLGGYQIAREEVNANGTEEDKHFVVDSVVNFIQKRSKCQANLRSLRLYDVDLADPEDLIKLMDAFPSLTHLTLDKVTLPPDDDFWSPLEERKYLTNLEHLEGPSSRFRAVPAYHRGYLRHA
ncbi:hypothetical protein DFP72DRAFT_1051377 [Ephemerocybe angulata]|uniref:F-box domain-containing protein n=1 Tax=Ephemerocybe angulata TaxID=980116 RepID=A0A8H6HEG0_9AGAR|nr:hypothetical protein DFP72DRAFT_1051377 [Tulosesus angulatus]